MCFTELLSDKLFIIIGEELTKTDCFSSFSKLKISLPIISIAIPKYLLIANLKSLILIKHYLGKPDTLVIPELPTTNGYSPKKQNAPFLINKWLNSL